jgi:hypothetical protein
MRLCSRPQSTACFGNARYLHLHIVKITQSGLIATRHSRGDMCRYAMHHLGVAVREIGERFATMSSRWLIASSSSERAVGAI